MLLVLFANNFFTDSCKRPKWIHNYIVWGNHVQGLHHARKFNHNYCMSERVFEKLLWMPYPKLQKDIALSSNSTSELGDVINPETTMAIGL